MIEFNNVTKIYMKSHLGHVTKNVGVSQLNLKVKKGEAFGLLGLNGAGKTTSIKLLLGLLLPTVGSVRILGQELPDQGVLRHIGYLPEGAYINKYLTGYETLILFAQLSGFSGKAARDLTIDMLLKVGLEKDGNKRISDYSKGMVQRIGIAQALLHDPEILILDEPITGLDPLAIQEIRELFFWLKKQGKTIILSSHNISEVEKICDRVGIMVTGKMEKIMNSEEWAKTSGRLETTFTETVLKTETFRSLKFMESQKLK